MELYLVRHPEPEVDKGVCYGQAEIGIKNGSLEETIQSIKEWVPQSLPIFSSPLIRCKALAEKLGKFKEDKRLMELNFGDWELKKWDDISPQDLEEWMKDYMNQRPPGGETGDELHKRVGAFLEDIKSQSCVIIAHLGSLRSIYAHVHGVTLPDAFGEFKVAPGEVRLLRIE